ncbi:asparagine-tRNA ligase Slm5 [Schizosaccharomyces cryophilus OY26]|uniref:asparagine--tRNA ligase n=1 Tax=Schizosaccharomyces cryophilus (strain OY26 / ATCC MYA-4695 / CBS 11777 / NBRC 106824 / NRRL Y48691) TaxID=653667 RepID=S9WXX7_SCHCR|nr:asparagine-tRNA ligase Slm5 [Schizosaccharomyces cryophilus OY26]EPY49577.1 asparagine-tRNA ligase Slm5 [Schizosaccharomyces cryophilus OY26]
MKQFLPTTLKSLWKKPQIGNVVDVYGWIRSLRKSKNVCFAMVSDGTCQQPIQVVATPEQAHLLSYGASVKVQGKLEISKKAALGKQQYELLAEKIDLYGKVNNDYPIQKKNLTTEFLRQYPHLRVRTAKQNDMFRLRSDTLEGLRSFLAKNDFIETNPPLLTSSDCEGAGEVFLVTPHSKENDFAGNSNVSNKDEQKSLFFGTPTFLTVSTQLHLEALALGMSRAYTITPAFRAENSHTSRHLAEFWMLEVEIAFIESLDTLTDVVEDLIKYLIQYLQEKGHYREHWNHVLKQWHRISYTEAMDALKNSSNAWHDPPEWGNDLSSEHERYLTDAYLKGPVFVTDYPASIKPFYMKPSSNNTVAAMDLLVPQVGELVGGSLRKDSITSEEVPKGLEWYSEMLQQANTPHGGFGLGIERLLAFLEGNATNVRETIPFPRSSGSIFA